MQPYDLNLRHLRALAEIARTGTISAAADAISVSQPALTQGLAKLERVLELELFSRSVEGMQATGPGQAMVARCEAAFAELERHARAAFRRPGRGFARPDRLMTSVQLRALIAVADAGSFVSAAAATGLSQPALHRAVRDLEQIGGAVLIERRGRGIALSIAGRRLARGARLAAAEIAAGLREAGQQRTGQEIIHVGTMPLARARVLPAALVRLIDNAAERPIVRVVEGAWADLIEPLRDGVIDMLVGALRESVEPDLVQKPLFRDIVAVIARAGHPLAGRHPELDDLARNEWIVGPHRTPIRTQWEHLFSDCPRPVAPIECGSTMVISGILARSDLLALLSPNQVAVELRAGILTRIGAPIAGATRTIGLTTRAGWRPTAGQRRFITCLANAAEETSDLLMG